MVGVLFQRDRQGDNLPGTKSDSTASTYEYNCEYNLELLLHFTGKTEPTDVLRLALGVSSKQVCLLLGNL